MVILTEDDVVIKKFSTQKVEVFVMSMRQYLDMFWSHLTAAKELFKALEFAAANPAEDRTKEYFEYFKPEALESGLKTGKFVSGRLNVNKHLAQTEVGSSVLTSRYKPFVIATVLSRRLSLEAAVMKAVEAKVTVIFLYQVGLG